MFMQQNLDVSSYNLDEGASSEHKCKLLLFVGANIGVS